MISNPSGNATISKVPITASTRSARLHFFQSATITHRHATLHGSARDCLPRSEGKSYDWQIHILAPSAKCDQLHTYKNILILLRTGRQFAGLQAFGWILQTPLRWRRQSRANSSLPGVPADLGKYRESVSVRPCSRHPYRLLGSEFNDLRKKFPTRPNRELFEGSKELNRGNREPNRLIREESRLSDSIAVAAAGAFDRPRFDCRSGFLAPALAWRGTWPHYSRGGAIKSRRSDGL